MEPGSSMAQTGAGAQVGREKDKGPSLLRLTAVWFVVAFTGGQWLVSMLDAWWRGRWKKAACCRVVCVCVCATGNGGNGFEGTYNAERGIRVVPRLCTCLGKCRAVVQRMISPQRCLVRLCTRFPARLSATHATTSPLLLEQHVRVPQVAQSSSSRNLALVTTIRLVASFELILLTSFWLTPFLRAREGQNA